MCFIVNWHVIKRSGKIWALMCYLKWGIKLSLYFWTLSCSHTHTVWLVSVRFICFPFCGLSAGWVGQLSIPPLQRWLRWIASILSWSIQRASASACESQRPSKWPQRAKRDPYHFSSLCPLTQLWCRFLRGLLLQVRMTVGSHVWGIMFKTCICCIKNSWPIFL